MFRQVRNHQVRWFCRHCWQEMPDFTSRQDNALIHDFSLELALRQSSLRRKQLVA